MPADELLQIFQDESRELLAELSRALLQLESEPTASPERLRNIFRLAHTLKGAAASVGRDDLASVAHALETALEPLRSAGQVPSSALVSAALATTDLLAAGVERPLEENEAARVIAGLVSTGAPVGAEPITPQVSRKRRRKAPDALPVKEQILALLGTVAGMANGAPADAWRAAAATAQSLAARFKEQGPEQRLTSGIQAALLQAAAGRPAQEVVEAALMALDLLDSGLSTDVGEEDLEPILGRLDRRHRREREPGAAGEEEKAAPTASAGPTLRIPVVLMDTMLYRLDELAAVRLRFDFLRRDLALSQEQLETALAKAPVNGPLGAALDAHRRRLETVHRQLAQEVHALGVTASALQDDVKEVRMVPIGPVLEPFRRVVRELALKLGKQVSLTVEGQEVRVDKRVLDLVRDPLTHLLRNAVDHGLERPEDRLLLGKPPQGEVRISARSGEAQIVIQVSDDGRGISPSEVKRVALARGIVEPARAAAMTDRELLNLIFSPGFSTTTQITETSGRGVGLDVVRENVAQLGGRIDFFSQEGRGAQFSLTLPLALSASRGLIVGAARQTYCLPLGSVEEVLALEPGEVRMARGRLAIQWRHQAVPYARLEDVLRGVPSRPPERHGFAALIALSDLRVAIGLDEVHGQEEIVVKTAAGGAPRLPFVAGVAGLADGRLISVLEPTTLLDAARGATSAHHRGQGGPRRQRTVVVADDSLTSRSMVSSVLEGAGYRTLLAPDGEAAFALLSSEPVELVVSDVEMPVLDGLSLVRRIRASAQHAGLPVILLTSLGDAQDRGRGAEAGASGYLNKQSFDRAAFLEMVQDFVGPEGE